MAYSFHSHTRGPASLGSAFAKTIMTEQFEEAWKASSKPFHGETIYTEDLVPIRMLQTFVSSIVRHIELHYSGNSLFLFDDWHAHDGFIVPAAPLSIRDLADHVATADSLYKWRQGDFEVYRSIYPDTLDFLLRVHVLDADDDPKQDPGIWGSLSFTGYGFDLAEIEKRGHGVSALKLARANSKEYFDRVYAG
jgi:hypothetical protein